MIVKNETPVLDRLFQSVRSIITSYVIVDTGSSDGTPEFIEKWMNEAGIPGKVYHHSWVNFGYNRNQALQLAYTNGEAEWILFIDADEELACSDPSIFEQLKPGVSYRLQKHHGNMRYALTNLVDISQTRWEWRGVVHEFLHRVEGSGSAVDLSETWIIYRSGEGARSRGRTNEEKFLADARLLEDELQRNPNDPRSRFYLAQSYRDAGHAMLAYENYLIRAAMLGWDEENYVAQYRAGRLAIILNKPYGEIVAHLLKAYQMRPSRGAEPLCDLAAYCRERQWYHQGYMFAKTGAQIPCPSDLLFVEKELFEWRIHDELAIAAFWIGNYEECRDICQKLLELPLLPDDSARVAKNLDFAMQRLTEK